MSEARDAAMDGKRVRTSNRPATRGELKQAATVRKKEAARKANRLKNKERVRKGKEVKADPGSVIKPSIWERVGEVQVYAILREMGDTTRDIDKFQRKRVLMALFIMLLGIPAGMFIHVWLYLAGPILGVIFYKMQAKRVLSFYRMWKFERQLNFSKFTRLVIPYLKASGGNTALYTIFNKILKRTENEADRRSLYQLMGEMGDNPSDLTPFTDFATRSSGTDMSYLFMSTIFDFQQSTFDTQVIDELGEMAGEDMMNAIDEIIALKLKRFVMFPTKVVMTSFILVVGLGAALMVENFKDIDLGGGMLEPESAMEETQQSVTGESDVAIPDDQADESNEPPAAPDDEAVSFEDWEAGVLAVAKDESLTTAEKADVVEGEARKRNSERAELITFEETLRSSYDGYKGQLSDDAFVLTSLFQARVVSQAYVDDVENPMAIVASNFGRSLYAIYANGEPANSAVIADYDRRVEDALAIIQADIDAVTNDD